MRVERKVSRHKYWRFPMKEVREILRQRIAEYEKLPTGHAYFKDLKDNVVDKYRGEEMFMTFWIAEDEEEINED